MDIDDRLKMIECYVSDIDYTLKALKEIQTPKKDVKNYYEIIATPSSTTVNGELSYESPNQILTRLQGKVIGYSINKNTRAWMVETKE